MMTHNPKTQRLERIEQGARSRKRARFAILIGSIFALGGWALVWQSGSGLLAQAPLVSEEYLLLGSPNRGAGEPMVFVNPKDSKNIIVVAMATLHRLPTGETPIIPRGTPEATLLRVKELSTPDGSRTDIAVTICQTTGEIDPLAPLKLTPLLH